MHLKTLLSKNLKSARSKLGISQRSLAAKAGVTPQTLSQIEAGQGNPTVDKLLKISRALDCSVSQLVETEFVGESDLCGLPKDIVRALEGVKNNKQMHMVLRAILGVELRQNQVSEAWPEKKSTLRTFSEDSESA